MTRIFLKQNVYDAALDRVRRLYDEFPEVIVSFSGGKDSTVVFHLCLKVARERRRLPLNVFWLDQEAEWQAVVDYVRSVMNRPEVQPFWFQGPFRLFNATTTGADPWLHCWRDGDEWIRPKEPNSIHENRTGTDRFKDLFGAFLATYFSHTPVAFVNGMRCQESPARMLGITGHPTYKDITWGKVRDRKRGHYDFCPIYDWDYRDVWKAIHDGGWSYCRLYDLQFQYGVPINMMRVSNVHHEQSIHSLKNLQELEPETWSRISARLASVNAVNMARECYELPKELPWMFASWREYRDHLLEKLIDPGKQELFRKHFEQAERMFLWEGNPGFDDELHKYCITAILVNDFEFTKWGSFQVKNLLKSRSRGSATLKAATLKVRGGKRGKQ